MLSGLFSFATGLNPFIARVESSAYRKERAAKWLCYYDDEQTFITRDLIARHWSSPADFQLFQLNIVKKIVNKRANLYRIAPRRTFTGFDQVKGDQLYRAANADVVLKRASRLTKLLKTSMIQVGWNNDAPTLHVVTSNILDVVAVDPMNPTEVIVTHKEQRVESVTYSQWTQETFKRLDYKGMSAPVTGNAKGVNPYGILPFVPLFDRLPDDCFFLPGGSDLIEAQEALNVGLAQLWRCIRLQSFGQAWATGVPAGDVINMGPNRAITLPEGGEFGFAAPNAPIRDVLSALTFLMREIAATNDLSVDVFDLDPRSESGAAKQVDQIDLFEARQDDIALWRQYEARLFEVLKVITNTHAPGTIPESATVSVDFAELQTDYDPTDRLNNAQKRLAMGVWSPVDILRAEDPDGYATRELAMQELLRRKDESAQLATMD